MMKALVLDHPGPVTQLRIAEMPRPEPGPGEIRVRVRAVGLNPVDYKLAAGGHPAWTWPHILGLDVAGEVSGVGTGVSDLAPGDRVFYHGNLERPGGFAEEAVTVAHVVARIPQDVSYEAAAALPCAGFTAWQAIHDRLRARSGQTLLIQGGAGGVGGFAVQLAHGAGARVLATCAAPDAEYVRRLGADEVIDYRGEDVAARVRALTSGRGVDGVLDTVSGALATEGLHLLTYAGGLVSIAGRPNLEALPPFGTSPSVHEVALGACYSHGHAASQAHLAEIGREMIRLLSEGRLDPTIDRVLEFEQIPHGLEELAQRRVRGKLVARGI